MKENLIAGLVSGIFVTLFVVVFREFWVKIVTPWFEERVYKDIHIEGKWYSLSPNEKSLRREIVNIKRHGHVLEGTMVCTHGGDEGREYLLSGSFRNLIVTLFYESSSKSNSDRGTLTLKSVQNGEKLIGKIAFYHSGRDNIDTDTVVWYRDLEELEATVEHIRAHEEEVAERREHQARIEKELNELSETSDPIPNEETEESSNENEEKANK